MRKYLDREAPNYDCGEEVAYWAPNAAHPVAVVIIDSGEVTDDNWTLRVQRENGDCEDVHASRLTVLDGAD